MKGIVLCAGGLKYMTNAFVCIHRLRSVGCTLPIEIAHYGEEEIPCKKFFYEHFPNIEFKDLVSKPFDLRGFPIKPFALLESSFDEVLYIDSDNIALLNPSFLFETSEYKSTGALFWQDLFCYNDETLYTRHPLLPRKPEFESGQIVIDKRRHRDVLETVARLNSEEKDFYYAHMNGDKDTFRLAFHLHNRKYQLMKPPIEVGSRLFKINLGSLTTLKIPGEAAPFVQNSLLHFAPDGSPLFCHKTVAEWQIKDYSRKWQIVKNNHEHESLLYNVETECLPALRLFTKSAAKYFGILPRLKNLHFACLGGAERFINAATAFYEALFNRPMASREQVALMEYPHHTLPPSQVSNHVDARFIKQNRETISTKESVVQMIYSLTSLLEEHKIPYWLDRGTLLGCYRDKSFIPWDLDGDIGILLDNHADVFNLKEKLEETPSFLLEDFCHHSTLGYKDFLRHYSQQDHRRRFLRLVDKRSGSYIDIMHYGEIWKGYFSCLSVWDSIDRDKDYTFRKQDILPLKNAVFEGKICSIPQNPYNILKHHYGDIKIRHIRDSENWTPKKTFCSLLYHEGLYHWGVICSTPRYLHLSRLHPKNLFSFFKRILFKLLRGTNT